MAEYSRMAKGNYTVTGGSLGVSAPSLKYINLPFTPDYVELINYTQCLTPADDGVPFAKWDASVNVTVSMVTYNPTVIEVYNGATTLSTDLVLTNGITPFSAGLGFQFGPAQQVVASTKGTTTSFQVTGHGYSVGDTVMFYGLYSTQFTAGMPQLSNVPMTIVTVTDANNFIVNWNTNNSAYTNLAASPTGAFVKKLLYPFLYEPGVNVITAITLGATTTIQTAAYHNYVVGQEVGFHIPTSWGTSQLNELPDILIPGSPVYGYVVSITDNWTFVVNINSSSYTAFTTNQPVSTLPGLQFPLVVAVGDVNTGGNLISAGSPLYPSPQFPTFSGGTRTINGPAIRGAFVNNTSQGFIIGTGAGHTDTDAFLGGADGDVIEWRAYLHDYSNP